jgi:hypothetical protein
MYLNEAGLMKSGSKIILGKNVSGMATMGTISTSQQLEQNLAMTTPILMRKTLATALLSHS